MISVGIDVSKGKSTVCIMKPGGEVLQPPFEINHTADELADLAALIESYGEEVRVIIEDTGHYHLPVVAPLVENGIFVKCFANEKVLFTKSAPRQNRQDRLDQDRKFRTYILERAYSNTA